MKKVSIFFSLLLIFSLGLQAQKIRSLSFAEFQAHQQQENDSVYVYNFWATWCVPCVKELPHFVKLAENYRDKKVKLIFVSLDFAEQIDSRVKPFVEKKQLKEEVWILTDVFDPPLTSTWIDAVSPEWSGSIPATLISQSANKVYAFKEQDFTYEELDTWLNSILSELK